MGALIANTVPCAKGVLCFCLDEVSKGPRARDRPAQFRGERVRRLRRHLAAPFAVSSPGGCSRSLANATSLATTWPVRS